MVRILAYHAPSFDWWFLTGGILKNEEKSLRIKRLLVIFIGVTMILSTFGVIFYGFTGTEQKTSYGKYKFYRTQNMWTTTLDKQKIYFNYVPTQTEDINVSQDIKDILKNKIEIDTTYDIYDKLNQTIGLAQYQIGTTLTQANMYVRKGVTSNNTFNFPIITCKDATDNIPVIFFKQGNTTSLRTEKSCVIAEAPSDIELLRVADRISFTILGIME